MTQRPMSGCHRAPCALSFSAVCAVLSGWDESGCHRAPCALSFSAVCAVLHSLTLSSLPRFLHDERFDEKLGIVDRCKTV